MTERLANTKTGRLLSRQELRRIFRINEATVDAWLGEGKLRRVRRGRPGSSRVLVRFQVVDPKLRKRARAFEFEAGASGVRRERRRDRVDRQTPGAAAVPTVTTAAASTSTTASSLPAVTSESVADDRLDHVVAQLFPATTQAALGVVAQASGDPVAAEALWQEPLLAFVEESARAFEAAAEAAATIADVVPDVPPPTEVDVVVIEEPQVAEPVDVGEIVDAVEVVDTVQAVDVAEPEVVPSTPAPMPTLTPTPTPAPTPVPTPAPTPTRVIVEPPQPPTWAQDRTPMELNWLVDGIEPAASAPFSEPESPDATAAATPETPAHVVAVHPIANEVEIDALLEGIAQPTSSVPEFIDDETALATPSDASGTSATAAIDRIETGIVALLEGVHDIGARPDPTETLAPTLSALGASMEGLGHGLTQIESQVREGHALLAATTERIIEATMRRGSVGDDDDGVRQAKGDAPAPTHTTTYVVPMPMPTPSRAHAPAASGTRHGIGGGTLAVAGLAVLLIGWAVALWLRTGDVRLPLGLIALANLAGCAVVVTARADD